MVVISPEKSKHVSDLEELFTIITKFRLKLNPEKCIFGVEAGKFLGFLLTERGIEANHDKCAAILAMRSPATVKEVQQLTGRMAALSHFVLASGEKGHPYFQCLRRNNKFVWSKECEQAFVKLKEYLVIPPVLCKPLVGTPLRLYFVVTERAVSAVLARDQDQAQKPIYFVSKVLQGPEVSYQALEKAALAVVFSARRLRHFFHSFTVLVMIDLPIQKVLKKLDVAGRIVKWAVELSEFDIKFDLLIFDQTSGLILDVELRQLHRPFHHPPSYIRLLQDFLDGQVGHHQYCKTVKIVAQPPRRKYHSQRSFLQGLIPHLRALQHLADEINRLLSLVLVLGEHHTHRPLSHSKVQPERGSHQRFAQNRRARQVLFKLDEGLFTLLRPGKLIVPP